MHDLIQDFKRTIEESYNRLAIVSEQASDAASSIEERKLDHLCRIGTADPATLKFLIEDYLRHLKHHLRSI